MVASRGRTWLSNVHNELRTETRKVEERGGEENKARKDNRDGRKEERRE